jgi:hypothetical protein
VHLVTVRETPDADYFLPRLALVEGPTRLSAMRQLLAPPPPKRSWRPFIVAGIVIVGALIYCW